MKRLHATKFKRRPTGFTLIELIFAMTMFTFFLVIGFRTIINIVKIYEESTISSNNQQVARSITEEISRQANFANSVQVIGAYGSQALCLGLPSGNVVFFEAALSGSNFIQATPTQGTLFEASGAGIACDDPFNHDQTTQTTDLEGSLTLAKSIPLTAATINQGSNGPGTNLLYWQPEVVLTTNTDATGAQHTTSSADIVMTISQPGTPATTNDVFASAITLHSAFYVHGATVGP